MIGTKIFGGVTSERLRACAYRTDLRLNREVGNFGQVGTALDFCRYLRRLGHLGSGTTVGRSSAATRRSLLILTYYMDYVDIPPVAGRLSPKYARPTQPPPRTQVPANPAHTSPTPAEPTPAAPAKTMLSNLPAMLLASTAVFPITGNFPGQRGPGPLLTTRDPLSIPITTVNFRRFVSKVGPIFWLQDRIEEILMWKRGWKVTTVWMAAYAFFCQSLFSRHVRFLRPVKP